MSFVFRFLSNNSRYILTFNLYCKYLLTFPFLQFVVPVYKKANLAFNILVNLNI